MPKYLWGNPFAWSALCVTAFLVACPADAATFAPVVRKATLNVASDSRCLMCEPAPESNSETRMASNWAPLQSEVVSRRAVASHSSTIRSIGDYPYGMETRLTAVGPSDSSTFGYNKATSTLRLDFTLSHRSEVTLAGEFAFKGTPIGVFFIMGANWHLSGPNVDISQQYEWPGVDRVSHVLDPGSYSLSLLARAEGSSFENGFADMQMRMAAFAMEQSGDFDGDGLLGARDIDLLTRTISAGEFAQTLDLTADGAVNDLDRATWVRGLAKTYVGDANLDGEFNSGDLIDVLAIGEYEDTTIGNSGWSDGDWDGDLEFTSGDLVVALTDGGYEAGQRVTPVPEPSGWGLALITVLSLPSLRRHRGH